MPWKAAGRLTACGEPTRVERGCLEMHVDIYSPQRNHPKKPKTHHPHAVPLPPPLAAVVAAASAADDRRRRRRRRTDITHTPAGGGRRRVADPTRARSSSIHPPARIWSRQPLGLASRQLKRRNCNRHRQVSSF
uniref:Uncharacterized protein n=1 Tax=Oryza glumipatula TaxID=40148 RepID=A0A0E0B4L8_9ORYZ